jgi:hypothetical protein
MASECAGPRSFVPLTALSSGVPGPFVDLRDRQLSCEGLLATVCTVSGRSDDMVACCGTPSVDAVYNSSRSPTVNWHRPAYLDRLRLLFSTHACSVTCGLPVSSSQPWARLRLLAKQW